MLCMHHTYNVATSSITKQTIQMLELCCQEFRHYKSALRPYSYKNSIILALLPTFPNSSSCLYLLSSGSSQLCMQVTCYWVDLTRLPHSTISPPTADNITHPLFYKSYVQRTCTKFLALQVLQYVKTL